MPLILLAASSGTTRGDDPASTAAQAMPQTAAERTNYESTSTYAEVQAYLEALSKAAPQLTVLSIGKSLEGRDLPLLILADPPLRTLEAVRTSPKLKLLAQANIHAGEVCGKEALLMLARDLLVTPDKELLQDAVVLFVPILNADGNERVSPDNRPGQNGPRNGMGIRENAQGLDLNRDFTKLESPEARAAARLLAETDPDIVIDTHATNGSIHAYAITYDAPRHPAVPQPLIEYARDRLLPKVSEAMLSQAGFASTFYGNFGRAYDRWETYPAWPRYHTQYVGLRNQMGILCEAYAYDSFQKRVLATRAFVREALRFAVHDREAIAKARAAAKKQARRRSNLIDPTSVAIRSRMIPRPVPISIRGQRDGNQPRAERNDWEEFRVPFLGDTEAAASVLKPHAYFIPPQWTEVLDKLRQHGIPLEVLREDLHLDVEEYRLTGWNRDETSYQDHFPVSVEAQAQVVSKRIPAGTFVARTNHPLSHLLIQLVEPHAEDSLLSWNFFDAIAPVGDAAATYPILRLMDEQPLLTQREPRRSAASGSGVPGQPAKKRRLTLELLSGNGALNLGGNPAIDLRWFPSGKEFVQEREGVLWRFDAVSGRATKLYDPKELEKPMADLTGLAADRFREALKPFMLRLDEEFQQAIVNLEHDLYLIELESRSVRRLTDSVEQEELVSFSPDRKHIAFVRDYSLYCLKLEDGRERRVSPQGSRTLRYGKADWVYFEEIYGRQWRSYHWSPDSRSLAFMEFDDRHVHEFVVLQHLTPRGYAERENYPKAGDPIPHVRVGIASTHGGPPRWIDLSAYTANNLIVTRYGWLPDSKRIYLMPQDRAQKWLDFAVAGVRDGRLKRLFREQSPAWVGDPGEPIFRDHGEFLLASERTGWQHLYRFREDGSLANAVTQGDWEVRSVRRARSDENRIFFVATRDSHLAEHLYSIGIDGQGLTRVTPPYGDHEPNVAPAGDLFVDASSSLTQPTRVMLRTLDGQRVRRIDSNPVPDLEKVAFSEVRSLEVPGADGTPLAATMILPLDFDPSRKYPVWVMTYGGPNAPTVNQKWNRGRGFEQLLATHGIIAFRCDPRSASGRGAVSTRIAYQQLGVEETKDMEAVASWLAEQSYVDPARIGLSGYSYGGYLTAYVMTHSKRFAAGIAGAPVTDWRNYDAFYTERYMNTPQENPEGYDKSSVVRAAKDLHGRLLLIHGAADDNVHLQNAFQLAHALQEHNRPFEMMIYPTSRHGIHGMHYQRLNLDFILRALTVPSLQAAPEPMTVDGNR